MLRLLIAATLLFSPTAFAKTKHGKGAKKAHHAKTHKKASKKDAEKPAAPAESVDPVPVPAEPAH